jgi:hypothetical protein
MIYDLHTALNYSKELKERPVGYEKPVVFFTGNAVFDKELFPDKEVAHVRTVNHPAWGSDKVRTSVVLNKFDDGSFETMNTMYKPYTDMEGS